MAKEFPKAYDPKTAEDKWYDIWLKNKVFSSDTNSKKPHYSILMPPPNVTGILHFGHVLNHTFQDIYVRSKRMSGYEVCWFPGLDHAGIATQSKVESELRKQGISRFDLGRERFLEKVWEWKENYGGIILNQLRKLGNSSDWDRTIFTFDTAPSNAVREVFIRLFDEGLIYKGKRIINWSPLGMTALSDEEVEFREVKEQIYTLKYYIENSDEYIQVATVRTETIYGDIAVAVNPSDSRYKHLIGKNVIVPYVNRIVPIISDNHADPEFGTGCVKITPAHDPNDFEVGKRHDLQMINTMNPDGTLNSLAEEFEGMDRFEARKAILAKLRNADLIEKIEDYTHKVGFSQRGGEPVEPYLSDQWFVNMKALAQQALEVVKNGEVRFHPDHWVKTYEHWMEKIRDWCISRQLWWGHRIPVFYSEDGRYTAATNETQAKIKLGLGEDSNLTQDEDVLDTWFSSWLWPMTTMGWLADGTIEDTDEQRQYLPTDLLVTAPDIIFFWVARMIMATTKFKNQVPFKDVYFTSTIRDGIGRKLSKSLGNSPDPLNIMDKYGTDAVRFTMIYLSPLGQDVRMEVNLEEQDIPSMELGRNFANKIWNAGRFLLMKREQTAFESEDLNLEELSELEKSFADKWILSRFNNTIASVNYSLDNFKLNDYSKLLYDFIWSDFCDWYVEIIKVQFDTNASNAYRKKLMNFAIGLYEQILHLLHPVMPFITEEIWHLTSNVDDNISISLQDFPECSIGLINEEIESSFNFVQQITEEIRKLRSNSNIPPHQKIPALISCNDASVQNLLVDNIKIITNLSKCETLQIEINSEKPKLSASTVYRETEIFLLLENSIDHDAELERLDKEKNRLEKNISVSENKLSNEGFISKAPTKVVEAEKEKLSSMQESLSKVLENIENLKINKE